MTESNASPGAEELELTLFGPGYGESIVLHLGTNAWVIVDSCIDEDGKPSALNYLARIGVDPAQAVELVVATHWHDDHIRGMAQIVEVCTRAAFCCAAVLCRSEFLSAICALEPRHLSSVGSGARELYNVLTHLEKAGSRPAHAIANRRVYSKGSCEVWALSPDDVAYQAFLRTMGSLLEKEGQTKKRICDHSQNEIAVALSVRVGDVVILLGSDLERRGWMEVVRSGERPFDNALAWAQLAACRFLVRRVAREATA